MPHIRRDPETGQFVSYETGHTFAVERFRDYEFVHVRTRYDVDAADLPGAFPITEEDIHVTELEDVLDRDERADLVAFNLHSLQATVPGTSSAENSLQARWELSLGTGSEMVTNSDEDFTADTGDSGVVDKAEVDSDNPDILYFAQWTAEGGFGDSTNGLGAGPDAPVLEDNVHYPREFGACPGLDERDDITESFRLVDMGSADISDSLIMLTASYTLVFAVEERERR
jgi:hypothetical protein